MDNVRLFLLIALSFVGLLIFQAWERDYGGHTAPAAPQQTAQQQAAAPAAASKPNAPSGYAPPAPEIQQGQKAPAASAAKATALPTGQRVQVTTDLLRVDLDTLGGGVRQADLLKYTKAVNNKTPTELLTDRDGKVYVSQSGFVVPKDQNVPGPDQNAHYTAEQSSYALQPGAKDLKVNLYWQQDGLKVTKTFTFYRGSYHIDVAYTVQNLSNQPWRGSFFRQLARTDFEPPKESRFIHTYTGGAYYTPDSRYTKLSFSDIADKNLHVADVKGGWVAYLQHYFLGAWIPGQQQSNTLYTAHADGRYYIGLQSPFEVVPAGASREFKSTLYIGPKLQDRLEALAPGLELTTDYGILTFIAKPLFWLLKHLHALTGNWGWAIILMTVMIKLAFYKLSETSYRSMAHMRRMQPRMQALKERFGDDRQKMNQALMELYKKEKINPLGGCLPIVVQIPVFIALYWVLLDSVELRQAPFVLWIHDLSTQDPYYVLPLIMGVTMFLQQRLNPTPMDPIQQKIMMFLPLTFTVFFAFFPAGLVLYYVVNNSLSIAQQWVITKRVVQKEEHRSS